MFTCTRTKKLLMKFGQNCKVFRTSDLNGRYCLRHLSHSPVLIKLILHVCVVLYKKLVLQITTPSMNTILPCRHLFVLIYLSAADKLAVNTSSTFVICLLIVVEQLVLIFGDDFCHPRKVGEDSQ